MTNRGTKLINFLFPPTCINCKKTGEYLCVDCKKTLIPHPEICPYCHRISANYHTCLDCKISPYNALEGVIIPFSYTDTIKQLITKFKYKHQKDLGDFLVERLVIILQTNEKLNKLIEEKNQIFISYIPTHRYRKHFVKGYNQSQVLTEELSQKIQIPIVDILQKPQASKAQAKLQRTQRLVNLQGKFVINPNINFEGHETIILVDDVTTTNSTLNEAARTIKSQYPFIKVRGLVIARHN